MAKRPSRKAIIKKLDTLIRDYLKQSKPAVCVTCNKHVGWFHPQNNPYGLQVSHYISRRYYNLRWDLKNVEPMCASCNFNHNQNPAPYSLYIINTYGKSRLEYLKNKRNEPAIPIKTIELIELYNDLKANLVI